MPRRAFVLLLAVALACVLVACSSTRKTSAAHKSSRGDAAAFDAIGAPNPSTACRWYLNAVAGDDVTGYLKATGHKVTKSELADVRQGLFATRKLLYLEAVWQLRAVSQSGATVVYKPVTTFWGTKFVGYVLGIRKIRDADWMVISAKPRTLSAADIVKAKRAFARMAASMPAAKPVIYLYPKRPTEVSVRLNANGDITRSVPDYSMSAHGWSVKAFPSGRLVEGDGRAYPYLFWEGEVAFVVPDSGFVVASSDVPRFLRSKLAFLGLSDTESAAFIKYWSPRMKEHPYCFVSFAGPEYRNAARLSVDPAPDTVIRVFVVYRPLASPISVPEQTLQPGPARKGFVVVEWGGSELGGRP